MGLAEFFQKIPIRELRNFSTLQLFELVYFRNFFFVI